MLNHSGHLLQLSTEISRFGDPARHGQVQDQVAVVRDEGGLLPTSHDQAHAKRRQTLGRGAPQERQDLDGEHADAQPLDQLRLVDQNDKAL